MCGFREGQRACKHTAGPLRSGCERADTFCTFFFIFAKISPPVRVGFGLFFLIENEPRPVLFRMFRRPWLSCTRQKAAVSPEEAETISGAVEVEVRQTFPLQCRSSESRASLTTAV